MCSVWCRKFRLVKNALVAGPVVRIVAPVQPNGLDHARITNSMPQHRIYTMSFAKVYPLYVAKAERKGRTKDEVDTTILWLTGYSKRQLVDQLKKEVDFERFFAEAPKMNPHRQLITGVVCGVRVEQVAEPLMREVRYLDKLIDELAKGKSMEKILRQATYSE